MSIICLCKHCNGQIGGTLAGDFAECKSFCQYCKTQELRDKMDQANVDIGGKDCFKCPMVDDKKKKGEE